MSWPAVRRPLTIVLARLPSQSQKSWGMVPAGPFVTPVRGTRFVASLGRLRRGTYDVTSSHGPLSRQRLVG
ncbi:MAG: hypothetical protein ACE5KY_05040, partial [Candidatus Tectimicrobiota bacterium]